MSGRTVLHECRACGARVFTRPSVCRACGGRDWAEREASGRGRTYAYATVRIPPEDHDRGSPYTLVLVELDGARVLGRLAGDPPPADREPEIAVGQEVEVAGDPEGVVLFRRVADGV